MPGDLLEDLGKLQSVVGGELCMCIELLRKGDRGLVGALTHLGDTGGIVANRSAASPWPSGEMARVRRRTMRSPRCMNFLQCAYRRMGFAQKGLREASVCTRGQGVSRRRIIIPKAVCGVEMIPEDSGVHCSQRRSCVGSPLLSVLIPLLLPLGKVETKIRTAANTHQDE